MKQRHAPRTMAEGLDFLLYDICVELGFCLPSAENARICATKSWDADGFAAEIIRIEGLNPDEHIAWKRRMRNRFIEMFGSNSIDSESFEKTQKSEGK
jgi:hypothetical protein